MKIFQCNNCSNPIFFENTACERCGYLLGYLDTKGALFSLNPEASEWVIPEAIPSSYTYCKNHQTESCNWLVAVNAESDFCTACNLNRTIPNLNEVKNLRKWQRLEVAKHRLIYQLQRLNLPIESKLQYPERGFCFDFIAKKDVSNAAGNIMTGHANGVITILLSEADSVFREKMRRKLKERYRTLIGHFRHEVGHYYWDRLIKTNQTLLTEYREVFGDERISYADALKRYYAEGPQKKWRKRFISKYASSHPWEDWAETWAHYLHLMDTMETSYYFGIRVDPEVAKKKHMKVEWLFDPYKEKKFGKIATSCLPLFYAMNSVNRSMGIPDVYPFVISKTVLQKMKFIHQTLWQFGNISPR